MQHGIIQGMHKTRVAVLRGGPSDEYQVSMQTGAGLLESLARGDTYQPIDVVISKQGEWIVEGVPREPEALLQIIDRALIGLHGAYGEDGQMQRLLERHGVPYSGSAPFQSSIALHKELTKKHLPNLMVATPAHRTATRQALQNLTAFTDSIRELFGPQYVIKPLSGGSSFGVTIVSDPFELQEAIREGLGYASEIIIEQYIPGREATCGVVNDFRNEPLYTLPVVEIIPPETADFYDGEVKYNGTTQHICPGNFTAHERDRIQEAARQVHEELGLSQYSRSDFIVGDDGEIYFLEVNTLPGMTPHSLVPKSLAAVGCSYDEFVAHLVEGARCGV